MADTQMETNMIGVEIFLVKVIVACVGMPARLVERFRAIVRRPNGMFVVFPPFM